MGCDFYILKKIKFYTQCGNEIFLEYDKIPVYYCFGDLKSDDRYNMFYDYAEHFHNFIPKTYIYKNNIWYNHNVDINAIHDYVLQSNLFIYDVHSYNKYGYFYRKSKYDFNEFDSDESIDDYVELDDATYDDETKTLVEIFVKLIEKHMIKYKYIFDKYQQEYRNYPKIIKEYSTDENSYFSWLCKDLIDVLIDNLPSDEFKLVITKIVATETIQER